MPAAIFVIDDNEELIYRGEGNSSLVVALKSVCVVLLFDLLKKCHWKRCKIYVFGNAWHWMPTTVAASFPFFIFQNIQFRFDDSAI